MSSIHHTYIIYIYISAFLYSVETWQGSVRKVYGWFAKMMVTVSCSHFVAAPTFSYEFLGMLVLLNLGHHMAK